MVADHEDLSGEGIRAAGHQDLFDRADGRKGRGIRSRSPRRVTHKQDAGGAEIESNHERVLVRVGVGGAGRDSMTARSSLSSRTEVVPGLVELEVAVPA